MLADFSAPGLYTTEIQLDSVFGEFQILRNQDWNQVFYPAVNGVDALSNIPVLGPDDSGGYNCWCISGQPGDAYTVEFQKAEVLGLNTYAVSWHRVQKQVKAEGGKDPGKRFVIVGTFNKYRTRDVMAWDGESYTFTIDIGSKAQESFQILQDGDFQSVLHPSIKDANPTVSHQLLGPDKRAHDLQWTVGKSAEDNAVPGDRFRVRLVMHGSRPSKVDWKRV